MNGQMIQAGTCPPDVGASKLSQISRRLLKLEIAFAQAQTKDSRVKAASAGTDSRAFDVDAVLMRIRDDKCVVVALVEREGKRVSMTRYTPFG